MTDEPENVELASPDLAAQMRLALAELIPGVLLDGVLDATKLGEMLGVDVTSPADGRERYGLVWAGKAEAIRSLQMPSRGTLVPDLDRSFDWDTAENVFIEGDNLEVLKLLQKAYNDKVKLIYIDPPYNTGNDFVYNDDFRDGLYGYLAYAGLKDQDGNLLSTSTLSEQRSGGLHSRWLNMMYPRLQLARNLLTQDGVIAVSIDDNEFATLRLVLDEIFGPENFVASIQVKARSSVSNDKLVSPSHNHLLVFARSFDVLFAKRNRVGLDPDLDGFTLSDANGAYKLVPVDGPGGARKGNPFYEFQGVEGYWRYSKETMQARFDQGLIVVRPNSLQQKYYLADAQSKRRTATTWWDGGMETSTATTRLKQFMGAAVFDNPKPIPLVRRLVEMFARDSGDLVLDFFAGSGTTGHAVLESNAHDGIQRHFICVTLPEPTNPNSEGRGAGFQTVSQITLARLERALKAHSVSGLKVVFLDASRFENSDADGEGMVIRATTLRGDLDAEPVTQEILLKEGIPLDTPWTRVADAGVSLILAGKVAVVLSLDITNEVVDTALRLTSERGVIVFLEDGFAGRDAVKANAVTQANKLGIKLKSV
jgi:adenine-specific DNA-methyltransferase